MRAPLVALALLLLGAGAPAAAAARVCTVGAADAAADGTVTAALQAALDACAAGGTVVVGPGRHATGGVTATGAGLTLRLLRGAALVASRARADYAAGPKPEWYALRFLRCRGCRLEGGGALDGAARRWITRAAPDRAALAVWTGEPSCAAAPAECRPRLLGVVDSEDVVVSGISIRDPVYWAVHVLRSRRVVVEDVRIAGDWRVPNNDGLDVDSSADVAVRRLAVDTADDAVCLKATQAGAPLERVAVTNATLRSRSAAVKLGSESVADMRDIHIADVAVRGAHRALAVQLRDGGSVRNVTFERVRVDAVRHDWPSWWGAAEAVSVTAVPRVPGRPLGVVDGVTFRDVDVAAAENGVVLAGAPGAPLRRVRLERIALRLANLTAWPGGALDLRPGGGVRRAAGGAAALWAEHAAAEVDGMRVVYASPRRADWGPPLHAGAGAALVVRGWSVRDEDEGGARRPRRRGGGPGAARGGALAISLDA